MASKENGEEIEQILISDKMKKYSSFILDDNIKTDGEMNNVLKKLLEDYQCGFDTKEENVRILNFISYLFWRKRDGEKAHSFAEKAKSLKTNSLVTLHNAIIFLYYCNDVSQCMRLMKEAKTLSNDRFEFKRLKAFAREEIAYCYSRMGPEFLGLAEQLFKKAIGYIWTPNRHYLWEFGLAMSLRKQTNIFAMRSPSDFNPKEKNKRRYLF